MGMCCARTAVRADEPGWQGKAAAGLNLTKGNSDTTGLNLEVKAERKEEKHDISLGALFAYGESDGEATEENAKAFVQYNRLITEKAYLYANCEIAYDSVASLDYRFIAGPGIGYYLLKDENQTLGIEVGASYVSEQVRADSKTDAFALRVTQRYERALSKTAKISATVEYLPELDDFGTFLLNAELGVETAISGRFSLRAVVQDRYDSDPAADVEENDVTVKMTLVYSIGK